MELGALYIGSILLTGNVIFVLKLTQSPTICGVLAQGWKGTKEIVR